MRSFIKPRLYISSAAYASLAWLIVLALAAWLAAGWFWRLSAPNVVGGIYTPGANVNNAANEITSRHLFGVTASKKAATPSAAEETPADWRVVGVMTGGAHGTGFIVVQDEGKTNRAVLEHEEIAPGIVLEKTLPFEVEISRNGQLERLALSEKPGSAVPAVPVIRSMPVPEPVVPTPSAAPQVPSSAPVDLPSRASRHSAPRFTNE